MNVGAIRADRQRFIDRRKPFFQDVLFERRWHGWARSTTTRFVPTSNPNANIWTSETIRSEWVRRPKGSSYREINYASEQEKFGILLREHNAALRQTIEWSVRNS